LKLDSVTTSTAVVEAREVGGKIQVKTYSGSIYEIELVDQNEKVEKYNVKEILGYTEGDPVVFQAEQDSNFWGGDNPNNILEVGGVYEVEKIDMQRFHTLVKLKGIKGYFNSVNFASSK
jgi:hypothetical protein